VHYRPTAASGGPQLEMGLYTTDGVGQSRKGELPDALAPDSAGDPVWRHVVWTVNNGIVIAYQNGVSVDSDSYAVGTSGTGFSDIADICLGDNCGNAQEFNGSMDEFRLYNRALSPDEVLQLHQLSPPPSGLVGYWDFDNDGVPVCGADVCDSSGYSHNGTLVGDTYHSPSGAGGSGESLYFDGTGDYVNLGNPPTLDLAGEITMAACIKSVDMSVMRSIVQHGHGTPETFLRIRAVGGNKGYEAGSWNGTTAYKAVADIGDGDAMSGKWVHVAGVYDGISWDFYRQGQPLDSKDATVGAISTALNWAIGAQGNGAGKYFNGEIDDVRIYKRGLYQSEIHTLSLACY
jgi:hypothetical protein